MTDALIIFLICAALVAVVFVLTHLRPMTPAEVEALSTKRRRRAIGAYYWYRGGACTVDLQFKKSMDPNGTFHAWNESLHTFPGTAAALLKYKKHEWVIVAFERDGVVRLVWLNKGPNRAAVVPYLDAQAASRVCQQHGFQSMLLFHNHPNPNPNLYNCAGASLQDVESARFYASALNQGGFNLAAFVCERGQFHEYYLACADTFLPLAQFIGEIQRLNGVSSWGNLKLHVERLL